MHPRLALKFHVTEDVLESLILLYAPPYLVYMVPRFKPMVSCLLGKHLTTPQAHKYIVL